MEVNNFSLEYARDENNSSVGQWYSVSGQPVFPFSFGSLLDEKLDEAYVTIVRDSTNIYTNNTLFRVGFYKHGWTDKKYKYFICASDNAFEMPIGSKKYTHKLYLIEVTKRMEGIMCQSVCFTNTGGTNYVQGGYVTPEYEIVSVPVDNIPPIEYPNDRWFDDFRGINPPLLYHSPVPFSSEEQKTMSADQVFIAIYNKKYSTQCTSLEQVARDDSKRSGGFSAIYIETNEGQTSVEFPMNGYQVSLNTRDSVTYNYKKPENESENALSQDGYEGKFVIRHIIRIGRELFINSENRVSYATIYVTVPVTPIENHPAPKPYTVAECVDRVLDLAEPLFLNRATGVKDEPRYALDPAQRDWLKSVQAPEFTMTQCTLREQLRVIGGYIHAEPRLMFNEEARVDDEGNVYEAKKFYVHFDKFTTGQASSLSDKTPYIGRTYSQDINQYCTKIETSASNVVNAMSYAKGVIAEPNLHDVKSLRTENVYVRIDEKSGLITTTYPIYEVHKVEFTGFAPSLQLYADITPYIFEKTEYDANLASFGGGYPYSKSYALHYSIGQKNIGGLFFKPQEEGAAAIGNEYHTNYAIVNILASSLTLQGTPLTQTDIRTMIAGDLGGYPLLCFRVSYVPIHSTRFSVEKPYYDPDAHKTDFAQVYNQSENIIEARYYGENVKGVAARLGNVDQERTYIFDSLDKLPRAGDYIEADNQKFIVSAINTEYKPFQVKSTVALTKGFNRLSQYVGVNSTKRVYEVSEREAYARNVHIKEFVIVGDAVSSNGEQSVFNDLTALRSIFDNIIERNQITAVNACSFYPSGIDWAKAFGTVLLPVIASAFGNAMVFSWNYKDNYSAGERAEWHDGGSGANTVAGWFQQDVPYGNFFGRAHWYYFYLMHDFGGMTRYSALSLPRLDAVVSPVFGDPPEFIGTIDASVASETHHALPLLLRKDSREALNFSYSVEFVSNRKDLIIGSAMTQSCCLVSGKENHKGGKPILVYLNRPLSEFDNTVPTDAIIGYSSGGYSYAYEVRNSKETVGEITTKSVQVLFSQPYISDALNPSAWAIITPFVTEEKTYTDEDGNPYTTTEQSGGDVIVASNDPKTRGFYMTPKRKLY